MTFALVLFVSITPVFAADDAKSADIKTAQPADVKADSSLPSLDKLGASANTGSEDTTTTSEDLEVDTSEEGKPEPSLPEVTAQVKYLGVVNMFGALSFINPKDVNDSLSTGDSSTKMTMALVLGVDADFYLFQGIPLAIGPRLEYVSAFEGKETTAGITSTIDASIIPVMAGATYDFKIPSVAVSLLADLYFGYGFGKYDFKTDNDEITASGGAFTMDADIRTNYRISDDLSAGLLFGYRMAKVSTLTADKDSMFLSKGTKLTGFTLDLSGLNLGVNVSMKY